MPTWLTIILALGGSAIITGVIGYILQRTIYKRAEEKDKLKAEQEKEVEEEKKELMI